MKKLLFLLLSAFLFFNCSHDSIKKVQMPTNALYIGNSLLVGYGFGMCATDSLHDYYHYLGEYFKTLEPNYQSYRINGIPFENATSYEIQNTWMESKLSPYLNTSVDFVLVQLGDNVDSETELAVFNEGSKNLLKFIKKKAPKAKIAWAGEWYSSKIKQDYIADACLENNINFIDISDLNIPINQGKIGDTITISKDWKIIVDDAGVASHPGNTGMQAIAKRILENLEFFKEK